MLQFPKGYFEDEVRDGFYVSSIMKKCWAAQLEVLSDIDRVCKRYDIRWYADCGSLLGAVRHGGFIPWDDDLDICMFRDDYFKFLTVASKELRNIWPAYDVLNYHNEQYWEPISRIVNAHDVNFDVARMEKFHGYPLSVGVDVFPLDFVCPDPEYEESRKNLFKMIFELADSEYAETVEDSVLEALGNAVGRKIDRSRSVKLQLYELGEMVSSLYRREEANEVCLMNYWYKNNDHKYSMELFDKTVMLPFENIEIQAPAGYDQVLKIEYGDYMRLVRSGGVHGYPHFEVQIERLEGWMGDRSPLHKRVSKDDLREITRIFGNGNPRLIVKDKSLEFIKYLYDGHEKLAGHIKDNRNEEAVDMLSECQNVAIQIGTYIEENQGEGFVTVELFEDYCELVYKISECLTGDKPVVALWEEAGKAGKPDETCKAVKTLLDEQLNTIGESIERDIKVKREVVFLPFKAEYWKSMESEWRRACNDPMVNAVVIPIPYYEKYPLGDVKEQFFDIDKYPDYVKVTDYHDYDFEVRQPDSIVIQYTYDDDNYVTTIDPYFYSSNLKQYTDELVYIPYFQTEEIEQGEERAYKVMQYYAISPAVAHADRIIVQSDKMKEMYVKKLTEFFGENTLERWERRIEGATYSTSEGENHIDKGQVDMPDEWRKVLFRDNGEAKKIIIYNTSISGLFEHKEKMIHKIRSSLDVFRENREDVALIWRPDPLVDATIPTTDPVLYERYEEVVKAYQSEGFGIYDYSGDVDRIMLLADAYYGDTDKLVQAFRNHKLPVMIQNVDV